MAIGRSLFRNNHRNQEYKDFGLSNKIAEQGSRFINRDGSFNVEKRGLPFHVRFSFYHTLITMSWWKFNAIVLISYLIVNFVFGTIYYFIGMETSMAGVVGTTAIEKYSEALFFSIQTLTTVGYGRVSPIGLWSNVVAGLESLLGLLAFALATGLLYGRFSRPVAHIVFSENALIAPYKRDGKALMLRIANAKNNQIMNMTAQLMMSWIETDNAETTRKFYTLPLEREMINFMAMSWTIVHPIDENSPLWSISKADFDAADAEIMIVLSGFDETFAQTVHARSSYKFYEVVWNAKFDNIFRKSENGRDTIIDLDRIGAHTLLAE